MPTGQDIVDLARKHLKEPYVLGAPVPKDAASWKGPWDCAEFASWLVYQLAGYLYGCDTDTGNPATADAYSGWWARDAAAKGRAVALTVAINIPGAFLIRKPAPGMIGHVALSAGDGTTVEAYSSRMGVIEGKTSGRRWDLGVLVPGFDYATAAGLDTAYEAPGLVLRLMSPPMRGALVERVQRALIDQGYSPGEPDGVYGPHTAAAVAAFQAAKGLLADGEVGVNTRKKLGVKLG